MPLNSTLVPGAVHVEHFADDHEYEQVDGEVVEEVEYITLDLGIIEPTLVPNTPAYRLIVSQTIARGRNIIPDRATGTGFTRIIFTALRDYFQRRA